MDEVSDSQIEVEVSGNGPADEADDGEEAPQSKDTSNKVPQVEDPNFENFKPEKIRNYRAAVIVEVQPPESIATSSSEPADFAA